MKRFPLWHLALLAAICLIAYANTLSGAFLWDDDYQIIRNPNVHSLEKIPEAFTQPVWGFAAPGEVNRSNFYRPTQTILYSLAYWWAGLDPVPFHVIQITLHVLATLLVYLVCIELGLTGALALLATAIFAAHPIHSEAIAWLAATPDLACGVFYFGALFAFLRSKSGTDAKWLIVSAILCFLALLSKEMAITFPLLAFALTFRPGEQPLPLAQRLRIVIPFAVVTAIYTALRFNALGLLVTVHTPTTLSIFDWVTLGIQVFGRYIWYALIPFPLLAYHQLPVHFSDRAVPTLVALASILGLAALLWRYRQRIPQAAFWSAAFPLMLIPVFYLKGISTAVMADRYLYIPSLAAVIVVVTILATLLPKQVLWVGWSLVGLFILGSIARNRDWRDAEHIWAATLDRDPEIGTLQTSMAEILMKRGDDVNAARRLNQALDSFNSGRYSILPDEYYRVHVALGAVLARSKSFAQAREHLEMARTLAPKGDWPYLYLGGISMEADNDVPKAIEQFQTAIKFGPLNDVAHDYLGIAYFNQGRFQEAKAAFEEALKINPTSQDARTHLDMAVRSLQQPTPSTP
ncbi:MAG: tetratricopeptide repeat protein [Bryobacteraceae bacterium]